MDSSRQLAVAAYGTASVEFMGAVTRYVETLPAPVQERILVRAVPAMRAHGVTVETLAVAHARVPHAATVDFCRILADESGDPACLLRAGAGAHASDWGLYTYLCNSAPSLGDCVTISVEFAALMHDGGSLEIAYEGDRAVLSHHLNAGLEASPMFNDIVVAGRISAGSHAVGFRAIPLEVHFQHARPSYWRLYEELLGAEALFDQPCNAIVMPAAALDFPLPGADASLHRILRTHAEELLARLPSQRRSLGARIRQRIMDQLPGGPPGLESLAGALTISASTLRRRLAEEGRSVSGLLEEVRRAESARMLTRTEMSISEIAFALGFAQPPAFHRAFRRWFGTAPLEYRRTMVNSALQAFLHR